MASLRVVDYPGLPARDLLPIFEASLAESPRSASRLLGLAQLRTQCDDRAGALECITRLLDSGHASSADLLACARLRAEWGEPEEALELTGRIPRSGAWLPEVLALEGRLQLKAQRVTLARLALSELEQVAPGEIATSLLEIECLTQEHAYDAVVEACESHMRRHGGCAKVLSRLEHAAWKSGSTLFEDLRARGEVVRSYSDVELTKSSSPRSRLIQHLRENADWMLNPEPYTTMGGEQMGPLVNRSSIRHVALQKLVAMLEAVAQRFLDDTRRLSAPWLRPASEELRLTSWAVRLAEGGHQRPHVHSQGWLSGVYCLEDGSANADKRTATEFGLVREAGDFQITHSAALEAGEVLVFPSYLRHRTSAHAHVTPRLCVAFDLSPSPGS